MLNYNPSVKDYSKLMQEYMGKAYKIGEELNSNLIRKNYFTFTANVYNFNK
jgi:hypothetical protein